MLVTFSCDAYENITMFGDVAKHLLRLMGHSGTVPGALLADEVPGALAELEQGIAAVKQRELKHTAQQDDEDEVSLAVRSIPLLNMLKAASKENCKIMWK